MTLSRENPLAKWNTLMLVLKQTTIQSPSTCRSTIDIFGLNCTVPATYFFLSFQMQSFVVGYSTSVPVPTKKKMFEFLYESQSEVPPWIWAVIFALAVDVSQTWKPVDVATTKWRLLLINFIELIYGPWLAADDDCRSNIVYDSDFLLFIINALSRTCHLFYLPLVVLVLVIDNFRQLANI